MNLFARTLIAFASLAAFAAVPASAQDRPAKPSGRVTIHQTQIAFIASGAVGGGTLTFKGRSYKFKLGGLGVGGVGASRLDASGSVYDLEKVSDFSGAYAAIRTGWALGDRGRGKVWLRNANGVTISLQGKRKGLQTALGAEGVVISLN
ncbi:MAG: hypothetical protein CTY15_03710 [Methylocystis sp.]|nr:MAG: hypothetical protein CTY15_03710 [Methylocystis sp.]